MVSGCSSLTVSLASLRERPRPDTAPSCTAVFEDIKWRRIGPRTSLGPASLFSPTRASFSAAWSKFRLPVHGAQLRWSASPASAEDSSPHAVSRRADAPALTLWPRTRGWDGGAWRGVVGRVLTGRAKWILATTKPRTGRGVPFSVVLWMTSP